MSVKTPSRDVAESPDGPPKLSSTFAERLTALGAESKANTAPSPEPVVLNDELAEQLGIDIEWLKSDDGVAFLAGNYTPEGSTPIAMAYAGHQFGGFSPLLGDGRALLLGEISNDEGELLDLHLKGTGRTPFSRGGDGNATLPAMLREYVMAEAMHALSVPTSRALAVVTTGADVRRELLEPGAVLARVAKSHIRVGTFELAARRDPELVRELIDVSIERHYPQLADADVPALELLKAVADAQASLIARWMVLGFVHGVMNTDNVLISGETIDYGPCAFLEAHDPAAVFSSIDRNGRYSYGNQPLIGQWNLARLAETLLTFIDDDPDVAVEMATDVLKSFPDQVREHWYEEMAQKLGLRDRAEDPAVQALSENLVEMMSRVAADHTGTFRALADVLRGADSDSIDLSSDEAWPQWHQRWLDALESSGANSESALDDVADAMDAINPLYIPRNHLVEEALEAARRGDLEPFVRLLEVTTTPFDRDESRDHFAEPASASFNEGYQTFCGT